MATVAVVTASTACTRVVSGGLGVKWGDDASSAASRLGMKCDRWDTWQSGFPFEVCYDFDRTMSAPGAPARPLLIRSGATIQGLS